MYIWIAVMLLQEKSAVMLPDVFWVDQYRCLDDDLLFYPQSFFCLVSTRQSSVPHIDRYHPKHIYYIVTFENLHKDVELYSNIITCR
jgi:hypothetical protein